MKLLDWLFGPKCPWCGSRKHNAKDCQTRKNWEGEK